MKTVEKILWALIFLSFLAALFIGWGRVSLEEKTANVALIMDYGALGELSRTDGTPEEEVISRFRDAGITGLAFSEDTLEMFKGRGLLNWYSGPALVRALESGMEKRPAGLESLPDVSATRLYIAVYDDKTYEQLQYFLPIFCGKDRVRLWAAPSQKLSIQSPAILEVVGEEKNLAIMGCGFSKERIDACRKQGMLVVLRPENKKCASPAMIADYTKALKGMGAIYALVFTGSDNDVLGYPDYLADTASMIKDLGCHLGLIEAPNVKAMQKGIQSLGQACAPCSLRVLSFPTLMQEKLAIEDLNSKFDLGVRERNIRLLYLRPYLRPARDRGLLESNIYYVTALRDTLASGGFKTGEAKSFADFQPPLPLIFVISCGIFAAWLLVIQKLANPPFARIAPLIVLWAVIFGGLYMTGKLVLWQKLSALAGGLIFPVLAFVLFFPSLKKTLTQKNYLSLAVSSSQALFGISLVTCAGGLMMAALLSSTEFLLQVDRFRGIKILMIVPPLLITLYYMAIEAKSPQKPFEMLKIPVQMWHLVALCVLGGAGAYYILRTGNTTEAATSNLELSLRAFLNKIMVVRPRFKDFLMGHPALMLFNGFLKLRMEPGLWLLVLIAAIGQADIIDTFAHLHTPLLITMLRVVYGLLLGWLVGLFFLFLLWTFDRQQEKRAVTAKE